jgi:hypothetical protein
MDTHLTARFRVGLFAASFAVLAAVGCGSSLGPGDLQRAAVSGTDSASQQITGTWRRVVAYIDEYGLVNSRETIWTFDPTGNAVSTMIIASVSLGTADTTITTGQWRIEGALVVIDFLSPTPGQTRLDAIVQGNVLFLGGDQYLRVS